MLVQAVVVAGGVLAGGSSSFTVQPFPQNPEVFPG